MNKKVISTLNNRSIVLIGMMGVGKTTIGKMLSEELKFPFYDSDKEIEKNLGKEINDIFNDYGEVFFRRAELDFFKKNINNEQIIISSGGGSFINKEINAIYAEADITITIDKLDKAKILQAIIKSLESLK